MRYSCIYPETHTHTVILICVQTADRISIHLYIILTFAISIAFLYDINIQVHFFYDICNMSICYIDINSLF